MTKEKGEYDIYYSANMYYKELTGCGAFYSSLGSHSNGSGAGASSSCPKVILSTIIETYTVTFRS